MNNTNPISVTYSDEKLWILVEEYITMQRKDFTFKGVCDYILYRAMEEERTKGDGLYESDQLAQNDCVRVNCILQRIINEQRIACVSGRLDAFVDDTKFEKK